VRDQRCLANPLAERPTDADLGRADFLLQPLGMADLCMKWSRGGYREQTPDGKSIHIPLGLKGCDYRVADIYFFSYTVGEKGAAGARHVRMSHSIQSTMKGCRSGPAPALTSTHQRRPTASVPKKSSCGICTLAHRVARRLRRFCCSESQSAIGSPTHKTRAYIQCRQTASEDKRTTSAYYELSHAPSSYMTSFRHEFLRPIRLI
jgi:hypothetical protein